MTELVLLSAEDARRLTDRIKVGVETLWELIKQAYREQAWAALGYTSWDEYCNAEFCTSHLRLPREERAEVVASMREIGMSIREIASATGESRGTIGNSVRSQESVQDWTDSCESDDDEPIEAEIVYDKKPATPREPRRRPITDAFDSASYELRRAVERVVNLMGDDRLGKNKDQIASSNLSDLVRVRDTLTGVIQQLEGTP